MVKTSAPWRWMPNDLPPWAAVYQQTQAVTNDTGELTWIDQGHTSERTASAAAKHGIAREVVKLPEAMHGFILLPRNWVVERSFAWATRFRRPVKDYERYAETLAGLHVAASACPMINQAIAFAVGSLQPLDHATNPDIVDMSSGSGTRRKHPLPYDKARLLSVRHHDLKYTSGPRSAGVRASCPGNAACLSCRDFIGSIVGSSVYI